jgi:hypothetical protein
MPSLSTPDSGGNGGRTPAVTLSDVRTWEYELMEALRDARHYIDWGTGSVMDDEDPPSMLKFKVEAHGAITGAEEFIEKILRSLKDFIHLRDRGAPLARVGTPLDLRNRIRVEALIDEARSVEATAARMLELLAGSEPGVDVAAQNDAPDRS